MNHETAVKTQIVTNNIEPGINPERLRLDLRLANNKGAIRNNIQPNKLKVMEHAKQEIVRKRNKGEKWPDIIDFLKRNYGVTIHPTTLMRWYKKHVLKVSPSPTQATVEHGEKIRKLIREHDPHKSTMSLEMIGRELGMTRERVRQICEQLDIDRPDSKFKKTRVTVLCSNCNKELPFRGRSSIPVSRCPNCNPSWIDLKCITCGNEFRRRASENRAQKDPARGYRGNNYCSRECFHIRNSQNRWWAGSPIYKMLIDDKAKSVREAIQKHKNTVGHSGNIVKTKTKDGKKENMSITDKFDIDSGKSRIVDDNAMSLSGSERKAYVTTHHDTDDVSSVSPARHDNENDSRNRIKFLKNMVGHDIPDDFDPHEISWVLPNLGVTGAEGAEEAIERGHFVINVAAELNNNAAVKMPIEPDSWGYGGNKTVLPTAESIVNTMEMAMARGQKVVVHCSMGMERSVLATVWYLIRNRGMNLDSAYGFVRSVRPIATDRRRWILE